MDKKLNLDVIQSFASAAVSTFEQMCSMQIKAGKPYLKKAWQLYLWRECRHWYHR